MTLPCIDIWYGRRQQFGRLGQPQRSVNILGTCLGPVKDGSLFCRVNNGPAMALSRGPDEKRLACEGDFNAEIPRSLLVEGENRVTLTAESPAGPSVREEVIVDYTPGTTWPMPFETDLADPDALGRDVQVIDGRWSTSAGGLRTDRPAYDRLLTFGDMNWRDYRASVTATIHEFPSPDGLIRGGFAVLTRWTGHPPDDHQPHREWRPTGMLGWYRAAWETWPPPHRHLCLAEGVVKDEAVVTTPPMQLQLDRPHVYEMTVRSRPALPALYRFRVRPADTPAGWLCDLRSAGLEGEAPAGAVLIIAYKTDVTISRIRAEPV